VIPKWHLHSAPTASSQGGSLNHSEDVVGSLLWRMIWAKSTYHNDSPRYLDFDQSGSELEL